MWTEEATSPNIKHIEILRELNEWSTNLEKSSVFKWKYILHLVQKLGFQYLEEKERINLMPAEESKANLLPTVIYLSEWQRNYFNQADDDVWGTGKGFFNFSQIALCLLSCMDSFFWVADSTSYLCSTESLHFLPEK